MKFSWIPCLLGLIAVGACNDKPDVPSVIGADHKHIDAAPTSVSMAKAKELGMPLSVEDIAAARAGKTDEAGAMYRKLVDLSDSEPARVLERYLKGQATDSEADRALTDLAPRFGAIEAAAAAASFAPQRDFALGMQVVYTEYEPMQRACIALVARGLRKAEKRDAAKAAADFEKAAAIISQAASEDLSMSEYLTTVLTDHWWRGAIGALETDRSMGGTLAAIAAEIPRVEAKKGVGTDLALIRATIARIKSGTVTYSKVAGLSSPAMIDGKSMDDILMENIDKAEDYATAFVVAAYENWADRTKVMGLLHQAEHASTEESPQTTALHAFEALAMAFTSPLKNGEALSRAEIDCLRIAVAARELADSGKTPTLTEAAKIAGVDETDPFGDKPYVLKTTGGKVVVYSVGLDGEDNNGKPYVPGEMKGTDIVVSL
ncbi:MAG: hypothetical protein M3R13_11045 [Armatimonadota bacterium]|nr:hypothetical protein [Armatimonadota bacterium]